MPASPEHIDKPEPRGQTIAAVLAVGAIYLALPRNVVVGPIWLLPTVIVPPSGKRAKVPAIGVAAVLLMTVKKMPGASTVVPRSVRVICAPRIVTPLALTLSAATRSLLRVTL